MNQALHEKLHGLDSQVSHSLGGIEIQLQPIPGEVPVIQVIMEEREELPIFITWADSQILCICYLWRDDEVIPERRAELLETLLDLNPSIPLSSFGRIGDRFVLFGALSRDASSADIAKDIAALSDNALDALDALSEFLL